MLAPKKVKWRKMQKGRRKGTAWRGATLAFGDYGLQAIERGWLTAREIEAARVALTRYIKRGGRGWGGILPDKPLTKKPAEARMGEGGGPRGQELADEVVHLRVKRAAPQLPNPMKVRQTKRDLARVKTVLRQRTKP